MIVPEAGSDFYSAMLALDAVLLLVLAVERRMQDEDRVTPWLEYVIGQALILAVTLAGVALFAGSKPALAWIVAALTAFGLICMSALVQHQVLSKPGILRNNWQEVATVVLPYALLAVIVVGVW
jgi:hypothetical protein